MTFPHCGVVTAVYTAPISFQHALGSTKEQPNKKTILMVFEMHSNIQSTHNLLAITNRFTF